MKLFISTQHMENYGAHDWDGTGECPQYWKMKGGEDYFLPVPGFRADDEFAQKKLRMIVDSVRDRIEWSNEGSRSYLIGYDLVEDDFLTAFEKSQLEYDGKITYPTQVLEVA